MRVLDTVAPPSPAHPTPLTDTSTILDRRATATLGLLVTGSIVIRSLLAVRHSVPRYFPDEYVYAALGRALGHGSLAIRGVAVGFPSIFEPLIAAPIWRLFGTATAYHIVQVENAVFASLTAIPIYLLARWLELSRSYALFCAAVGLLLPDLTFSAFTVSDLVAYPLVLTAFLAGVRALESPTTRRQMWFLGLATLSVLTRIEYTVIVIAYLFAAVVIERRGFLRTHRLATVVVVPVAGAVAIGAFGFYGGIADPVVVNPLTLGHWFVLQAFLLTVETGVVLVPGAVAGLLRPSGRKETVYAVFAAAFTLLVIAASTEAAAGTTRFKERYLFAVIPLVPLAFGIYLRRRPLRMVVVGLAAVLAIAIAKLPLSSYTASVFKSDSQFLFGEWFVERHLGTATASLVVAGVATLGCVAAVVVAVGNARRIALTGCLVFLALGSAFSTAEDLHETKDARNSLPPQLGWVNAAAGKTLVTAIATTPLPSTDLREALYWNTSIQREVTTPRAVPTDVFNPTPLKLGSRGEMLNVSGDVLFDDSSATGVLANARAISRAGGFTLWRPLGNPRMRLLITNRYPDGWLGPLGSIRAWPRAARDSIRVTFTLSLPRHWPVVRLVLGRTTIPLRPGETYHATCQSRSGQLSVNYSSKDVVLDKQFRHVVARLSHLAVLDQSAASLTQGETCTTAR